MDQLKKNKTFLDSLSGKQLHLLGVIIYIGIAFYAFFDFLVFNKVYIYTDIGSDTFNAFWPRYVCVADYLREYGFPSWSFKQGMGQNILPDSIGDPFNWILYIAGRNYIPYAIGYVEVLKIILAGSFFLAFLRQLNRSNYVALMGSLCYAFSGFMIVGSGWYIFSTGGVLFALLLLSSEYVFQHKNTWLFPITICILGCANPFNWYTFGIVLWLYLTIRYFSIESKGLKGYVQLLQRFLFLAILGIGISAIISFSTIIEMLESPRVAGDAGLFSDLKQRGILYLETANYYATVVLSFFSSDLQGTGSSFRGWSNYLEAPSFYCGLISLLLASQMLIFRKNEANYLLLLFAGLVLIPAFIPFFRYVVWGFSGDYFRGYAFWVILAIIFLSTKSLEDILKKGSLNIPFLFSVLLICTVILAIPVDNYPASGNLRFYLIIGLICYASLIFLLRIPQYSYHAQIVLLFLLSIELATASKITTSDRIALERSELDKKTAYNDYTIEAVEYLKIIDPGFYRIEKAYSSGAPNILSFNDAQIQNFYGTSSYYSFNHPAYIRFLDKMGVIDGQNEYQTRWSVGLKNSPLLQTYASTKYLLFKSGTIRDISGYHRKKWLEMLKYGKIITFYRLALPAIWSSLNPV